MLSMVRERDDLIGVFSDIIYGNIQRQCDDIITPSGQHVNVDDKETH